MNYDYIGKPTFYLHWFTLPCVIKVKCLCSKDLDSDFCYLQCSLNKEKNRKARPLRLSDGVTSWVRPVTFNDLKAIIKAQPAALMVCGHTGNGGSNSLFKLILK